MLVHSPLGQNGRSDLITERSRRLLCLGDVLFSLQARIVHGSQSEPFFLPVPPFDLPVCCREGSISTRVGWLNLDRTLEVSNRVARSPWVLLKIFVPTFQKFIIGRGIIGSLSGNLSLLLG